MNHLQRADPIPESQTKIYDLCIIGGGLAGLAAALEARRQWPGHRIALIESRTRLGGRAGSFIDPKTGNWVDNCQHVGLGCCDELIAFVNRLGAPNAFRRVPELKFLAPDGTVDVIYGTRWLPAPLHLAPAFARIRFLSTWDKLTLGLGLLKLAATPPRWLAGRNVADWLKCNFQTSRSIKRLWEPVLVSALNDSLDKLDLACARKVFVESFFARRDGFHLLVPAMPLGELFDTLAREALTTNKIDIFDNLACHNISKQESHFHLELRDNSFLRCSQAIIATPWKKAAQLCESINLEELAPLVHAARRMNPSPITGIHLQLDRTVCHHSEIALLDTTTQWIFDHTQADHGQPGCTLPPGGQSLHLVVSASHELCKKSRDEILEILLAELNHAFPEMQSAQVLSAWVVTEHAATFSPSPEAESVRPAQNSPVAGLALAGDWTQTGWPATMEGAIRSGLLAARALI